MKILYGLALGALAMLSLAGCTTLGNVINDVGTLAQTKIVNPINDREVKQIGNVLGTANGAVVGYAALKLCPVGHTLTAADFCHDKGLLKALDADMHVALVAYTKLVDFQKANPKGSTVVGGGFSQLFNQAKQAVATVTDLIHAYKVGGAS